MAPSDSQNLFADRAKKERSWKFNSLCCGIGTVDFIEVQVMEKPTLLNHLEGHLSFSRISDHLGFQEACRPFSLDLPDIALFGIQLVDDDGKCLYLDNKDLKARNLYKIRVGSYYLRELRYEAPTVGRLPGVWTGHV